MNRKKGIFITGTDTGVGKTVVAAVLARVLQLNGVNTGIMKPVTSGCLKIDGKLVSDDAELLAWAAGITDMSPDSTPYLLDAPLAPSVAASLEGVRIDLQHIRTCYDRLSEKHDFMIVEGAGGLMVPLAGGMLIADLILTLGLPALVVARPNLGTINHTLLTTFTARQLGIDVRGIVINNQPEHPGPAEEYAPHLIDSLSGRPLLGVLPHVDDKDRLQDVVEDLAAQVIKQPATRILLREIGIG